MTDFILHCGVSVILMLFIGSALRFVCGKLNLKLLAILVLTIGIGKEVVDFLDYGLFSLSDLEHDFVGIAIGYILIVALSKRHKV
jgi:hypothetical protein